MKKDHLKKHLKDKGSFSELKNSPVQLDILIKLREGLSEKQIANRRGTSIQAVNEVVRKLNAKGYRTHYLKKGYLKNKGDKSSTPFTTVTGKIRAHAQRFKIFIGENDKYMLRRKKCNFIFMKGCKVFLHSSSIEVIAGDTIEFYGKDSTEAVNNSWRFWDWFFDLLEDDLKIPLFKDRKQNFKITFLHLAREGAAEASGLIDKNIYQIRSSDDGRVFLQWDKSKGPAEREYVRAEGRSLEDSEILEPFFDDLLQEGLKANEVFKISDLKILIKDLIQENKETAAGLSAVVELLRPRELKIVDDKQVVKPDYVG